MGAYEAGLQLNGFLEEAGAFSQSLLPKPNDAQDGIGGGSCFWIRERQTGLMIGLLQPPLLDQHGSLLEGLSRCRSGYGTQHLNTAEQQDKDRPPSPPRLSTMLTTAGASVEGRDVSPLPIPCPCHLGPPWLQSD